MLPADVNDYPKWMSKLERRSETNRMDQKSTIIGSFAVAGLVLAAMPAAAQTTVRASSWHPPQHPGVTGGYEPFIEHVVQATDGSLDFTFWSGGSLLGATDTLPGIRNGIADIGVLALTYFPAEFPHAQMISDLAMLSDNPPAIAAAGTEFVVLHCKPCREDFTNQGLVFTSSYSTTPYTLISKQPIEAPEDLKGKTYRSAGTVWDRWVDYVGGTAVNVSSAEIFEALDRGGVDVAIFSPAGLKAFSLWDVAEYDTMLPLGTYAAMSLFTVNQEFWNSLTKDQRRAILDGAAVGGMGVTYGYMENDEEALAAAAEHGVEIVEPSQALLDQREAFVEQDLAKVEQIAKERYGIENPGELIATYRELLEKWEGISKEVGDDHQKMIEAMQTEIFDKVDLSTYGG